MPREAAFSLLSFATIVNTARFYILHVQPCFNIIFTIGYAAVSPVSARLVAFSPAPPPDYITFWLRRMLYYTDFLLHQVFSHLAFSLASRQRFDFTEIVVIDVIRQPLSPHWIDVISRHRCRDAAPPSPAASQRPLFAAASLLHFAAARQLRLLPAAARRRAPQRCRLREALRILLPGFAVFSPGPPH